MKLPKIARPQPGIQIKGRFTRRLIDLLDRFQLEDDMITGSDWVQRSATAKTIIGSPYSTSGLIGVQTLRN